MNALYLGDKVAIEGHYWLRKYGAPVPVVGTIIELKPHHVVVEIPHGAGTKRQGFPYRELTRA